MIQKIVALILVRMGSTRLPGKAMIEIAGKPMLGHIISRVQQAKLVDEVVVCTSVSTDNDVIEKYCSDINVSCFRGNESDVSTRMLDALSFHNATVGVTIFGDCPLVDPNIIDQVVDHYLTSDYDFVGNDLKTTYPPGMEAEAFSVDIFAKAISCTPELSIREHGTLVLRGAPHKYKLHNIDAPAHLNRPELEIEVDEAVDIEVIEPIISRLGTGRDVDLAVIIKFLDENSDLIDINQSVSRRWKSFRT
ncbi:MAG: spore coat polysaccharide biosynthesis protein SpsF (cytidylyltransferase family) [Oleiphilaceae bacterium]|jgi:spore coat polysaccharide biosynthesis protein SpsF (cytidylyltransferase family)